MESCHPKRQTRATSDGHCSAIQALKGMKTH
jgi:hypothetical protein